MPFKQRCFCQRVVLGSLYSTLPCDAEDSDTDLWFVHDPKQLYNMTKRSHWNKEALDVLLDRKEYCGKYTHISRKTVHTQMRGQNFQAGNCMVT